MPSRDVPCKVRHCRAAFKLSRPLSSRVAIAVQLGSTVDEIGYLRQVVHDLGARAVIKGGNEVYLVGQSNGGGMALSAARQRPDAYAGVAAFMPFVGFSPAPPNALVGSHLRRVMFAYSNGDPAFQLGGRYGSWSFTPELRDEKAASSNRTEDLNA